MDVPMLDEREWEQMHPRLINALEEMKRYRVEHSVSVSEARRSGFGRSALQLYFELTGVQETNVNAVWHHRASNFGPPCTACGKPLRTPRAKVCAECGSDRAETLIRPRT